MRLHARAIAGALTLTLLAPAASLAQSDRSPFADLFGRAPSREGREFTAIQFRTMAGAQVGETLRADFAEQAPLPDGLAGGADANLSLDYIRTRVQAQAHGRYSYQEYREEPAFGAPAIDTGLRLNVDATSRLAFQAGGGYVRSPFFRLMWQAPERDPSGSFGAERGAIVMMRNDTFEANAGVTAKYTRRSSLSAQVFQRETRFDQFPQHTYSARGFRGQWKRQMSRNLALRAVYGREELRPEGDNLDRRIINELIDVGVDYARSMSLARRTSLSFATQTSMLRQNDGTRKFRVNGNINLERYFGRTWRYNIGADRNTEFLPGFRAPVFTERARTSLSGFLSQRIILTANADAGQGQVAFFDERKFQSYSGDVRLVFAATRHLGVFAQYGYYQYRMPADPSSISTGLPLIPRLSRQAVAIGIQAWIPIVDKEKVPSDTR